MRIKGIVQEYIAGADPKSAPVARLLISSGKNDSGVGTRVGMPGLQQAAAASLAARGDGNQERYLGLVTQCKEPTTAIHAFPPAHPSIPMHWNGKTEHPAGDLLHQIGSSVNSTSEIGA
jgi:hypothetical protein